MASKVSRLGCLWVSFGAQSAQVGAENCAQSRAHLLCTNSPPKSRQIGAQSVQFGAQGGRLGPPMVCTQSSSPKSFTLIKRTSPIPFPYE